MYSGQSSKRPGCRLSSAWRTRNQEMACRDASCRRKPESSAGERQSTGCAGQLQI